jgi:hypothetical protein
VGKNEAAGRQRPVCETRIIRRRKCARELTEAYAGPYRLAERFHAVTTPITGFRDAADGLWRPRRSALATPPVGEGGGAGISLRVNRRRRHVQPPPCRYIARVAPATASSCVALKTGRAFCLKVKLKQCGARDEKLSTFGFQLSTVHRL